MISIGRRIHPFVNTIAYVLGMMTVPLLVILAIVLVVRSRQQVKAIEGSGPPAPGWWWDQSKGEWRPPGG